MTAIPVLGKRVNVHKLIGHAHDKNEWNPLVKKYEQIGKSNFAPEHSSNN